MSLLIDPPGWPAHGKRWSHLVSDTSLAELHEAAALLGIPRRAFEGDHYDVPAELYERALRAGAEPVPTRVLLARLRACGLRRPKRRGEKVLEGQGAGERGVDVVLAGSLPAPHGRHRLVVPSADGRAVRTVRRPDGADLPLWPQGAPPPGVEVLGFRRVWSTHEGRRQVRHDGVLRLPAAGAGVPAAGTPGDGWTALDALPDRWWRPLLAAAGLLPG